VGRVGVGAKLPDTVVTRNNELVTCKQ